MNDGRSTSILRRCTGTLSLAKTAVVAAALTLALAGCGGGSSSSSQLSGTVRVDGSSTVFPMTSAVAEEFMNEHPRVRVAVSKSGTGGGFAKFLRGETAINDASRPISAGEKRTATGQGTGYIELPVAYDGLAVVANPQNDWAQCLTTEELRRIWAPGSGVNSWSDVREAFPDQPLKLYGPGTASGTFDYFTEAVVGESGQSRTDFNASEDDNVLVQGVEGDPGALGFFGLAYYENNAQNLKLLGVDDNLPRGNAQGGSNARSESRANPEASPMTASGERSTPAAGSPGAGGGRQQDSQQRAGCVKPSSETVSNGTYKPLSRPLFIYVNASKSSDPATEAFVEFYLQNIGGLAEEVGYVPLTEEEYDLALQRFQSRTTGSMFEGEGQDLSLEERLRQGADSSAVPAADTSTVAATRSSTPGVARGTQRR